MENFYNCFPLKTMRICDEDEPWVTKGIKRLDRLRKREFDKHKQSEKWSKLNQQFQDKYDEERENTMRILSGT